MAKGAAVKGIKRLKGIIRNLVYRINAQKKHVHYAEMTLQLAYCFSDDGKESLQYFKYYEDVIDFLEANTQNFRPINSLRVDLPKLKKGGAA